SRIITMVLLGILGYADGLGAQQVAALPRFHHQWVPDRIQAEPGAIPPAARVRLEAMGHVLDVHRCECQAWAASHVWGSPQTGSWDRARGPLEGGSDPRNLVGRGEIVLEEVAQ